MDKKFTHYGVYGLLFSDDKLLLIKKYGGPYSNKLDLPGGTIEFGETPEHALIREMKEEVGIDINAYNLIDACSVEIEWEHKGQIEHIHHIAIVYQVSEYENCIKQENEIDSQNNDSLGANFYDLSKLKEDDLSLIAREVLNRQGFCISDKVKKH